MSDDIETHDFDWYAFCRKNAVHKLQATLHPERHPDGPEVEGLPDYKSGDISGSPPFCMFRYLEMKL